MQFERHPPVWGIAACALLLVPLLWDFSGLDVWLAYRLGGAESFSLRDTWWLKTVFHEGGRWAAWTVECFLCLFVTWPIGPLRQLPFERRLQLALSALVATSLVAALKSVNLTSCPWDLQIFGGIARYQSHWTGWQLSDGGAGHCFPAGHASAGFGFVGGWFALRRENRSLAVTWLSAALFFGLVLGLAQQLRGAHFMSHTLWTAWTCWMAGWVMDLGFTKYQARASRLKSQ